MPLSISPRSPRRFAICSARSDECSPACVRSGSSNSDCARRSRTWSRSGGAAAGDPLRGDDLRGVRGPRGYRRHHDLPDCTRGSGQRRPPRRAEGRPDRNRTPQRPPATARRGQARRRRRRKRAARRGEIGLRPSRHQRTRPRNRRPVELLQQVRRRICGGRGVALSNGGRAEAPKGRGSGAVKILIVDDHPIVRAGLRRLLAAQPEAEVCEAAGGREALTAFKGQRPDVVILDLNLPDIGGIEIITRLKTADLDSRILVLSMHSDRLHARHALQAGARGYASQNISPDDPLEAISLVAAGGTYIEREIAEELAFSTPTRWTISPRA